MAPRPPFLHVHSTRLMPEVQWILSEPRILYNFLAARTPVSVGFSTLGRLHSPKERDILIKKCETSQYALMILDNLFIVMSKKIIKRSERIELLTARSIRNKLLAYFELEAKKNNSKSFNLNYSYTDLADYLAIDRSAMMRELKNLKEDRLIKDVNKKITLLF